MSYVLIFLLTLWAFWYLYLIVMGLYRAKLNGTLTWTAKILGAPVLIIGFVLDVIMQYTVASIIWREWPAKGEHLVTDRMQRYLKYGKGSRYLKAKWLCEHLLDPFDPTGKHC